MGIWLQVFNPTDQDRKCLGGRIDRVLTPLSTLCRVIMQRASPPDLHFCPHIAN